MGIFTKKNKKKQKKASPLTPEQHSPDADDDHETTDDGNVSLDALDYLNHGDPAPVPPVDPQSGGPSGPHAETLLEILGLPSNASWAEIRQTHQALMVDHDVSVDEDASRVALARAIRREMNTAYAALRLLAVD